MVSASGKLGILLQTKSQSKKFADFTGTAQILAATSDLKFVKNRRRFGHLPGKIGVLYK